MRKLHVSQKLVLTLLTFTFFIYSGFTYAEEVETGLFSPAGMDMRGQSLDDSPAIRSRLVTVRTDQLCRLENLANADGGESLSSILTESPDADLLKLNLFDDVYYDARILQVESTFSGGTSFMGYIEDAPGGEIILVKNGEILSGNINVNGHFYQLRTLSEGLYSIQEIDQGQFPQEMPGVQVNINLSGTQDDTNMSAPADTGKYIDVMVVYTADARSAVGGTSAMENLIDLAVSESNTGYNNSGITQRLRLVHTAEVDYSEAGFNWSTTLTRLRSTSDGYMDEIHSLRDTYGADEVVLIVNNTASCGIGYVMQYPTTAFAAYAFCVVSKSCATGYYSFAHELGHTQGCAHDRDNAGVVGAYDYSYGYQAPDEAFRTIMAYNCPGGCTRVNYWSNPDKTYGGQAMGVDSADPEAADNRLALNNTLGTVRNFRQAISAPSIAVTSPNGGETLTAGDTHTITWTTSGTVGNVKIMYYNEKHLDGVVISASTANDGSFTWTVPDDPSINNAIEISEAADGSPSDFSNDFFTIETVLISTPTITVTSPNGGESLSKGSSHTITWTTTGTVGNVKIEYSTNNGGSWSTVSSSTANDGSHAWTVPDAVSSQCFVRISEAADGSPTDNSNAAFSIVSVSTPTVTVTSPNGGESLSKGSTHTITWTTTGTVGNVKIEYSTNNGGSWKTISSSTANDGSHAWTVPDAVSSQCKVKISEASDGNPSDTSNTTFAITSSSSGTTPTLTVTSPNGGESLEAGSTHTISWTSTGTVGNVKIEYSLDNGGIWTTISAGTANDGDYDWTVPNTESSRCIVRISEASDGNPSDTSNSACSICAPEPGEIALNRTQFNFGSILQGTTTSAQSLRIDNAGGGTLNWTAVPDGSASWLSCSPGSGTDSGTVKISVNASGLAAGEYSGTITVADDNATNSPQTVSVSLTVKNSSQDQAPFGEFATPLSGSAVGGSVAVTGWIMDDVEVTSVKIYNGSNYLGDAVFVEGARSDIETAYSTYPRNYQAGWGYMLLTYFLPDGGNGTYNLTVKATDSSGKVVTLGTKTITVNNAEAVLPFGAIDSPTQGGEISGSNFKNSGWVLTPQPNEIPKDGSTIDVYIDGKQKGHPTYNIYRSDIAGFFPGYANTDGAAAQFKFDTREYANGIHSIFWVATDNAGNAEGIGSRFFLIQNSGSSARGKSQDAGTGTMGTVLANRLSRAVVNGTSPVTVVKGFGADAEPTVNYPAGNGYVYVEIYELERVELRMGENAAYYGSQVIGEQMRPLPIGSTLDRETGTFYWTPGPGFVGDYELVFSGKEARTLHKVVVRILPGGSVE